MMHSPFAFFSSLFILWSFGIQKRSKKEQIFSLLVRAALKRDHLKPKKNDKNGQYLFEAQNSRGWKLISILQNKRIIFGKSAKVFGSIFKNPELHKTEIFCLSIFGQNKKKKTSFSKKKITRYRKKIMRKRKKI